MRLRHLKYFPPRPAPTLGADSWLMQVVRLSTSPGPSVRLPHIKQDPFAFWQEELESHWSFEQLRHPCCIQSMRTIS